MRWAPSTRLGGSSRRGSRRPASAGSPAAPTRSYVQGRWSVRDTVRDRSGLERVGFFACSADLEEELVRAAGVTILPRLIELEGDAQPWAHVPQATCVAGPPSGSAISPLHPEHVGPQQPIYPSNRRDDRSIQAASAPRLVPDYVEPDGFCASSQRQTNDRSLPSTRWWLDDGCMGAIWQSSETAQPFGSSARKPF